MGIIRAFLSWIDGLVADAQVSRARMRRGPSSLGRNIFFLSVAAPDNMELFPGKKDDTKKEDQKGQPPHAAGTEKS